MLFVYKLTVKIIKPVLFFSKNIVRNNKESIYFNGGDYKTFILITHVGCGLKTLE